MDTVKILLVEDNDGDILLTGLALENMGIKFCLSVVIDGDEAISYLDNEDRYTGADLPDLILLDINLPKKNGHEVLKHIKRTERLKHIPVVMLTTSSAQNDIAMAIENKASDYITKSSELDVFFKAIASIVHTWAPVKEKILAG